MVPLTLLFCAILLPAMFFSESDSEDEQSEGSTCDGEEPLKPGSILVGSEYDDVLFSDQFDVGKNVHYADVEGLAGDDTLFGSGNASIGGGAGDDVLVLRAENGTDDAVQACGAEGRDLFVVEFADTEDDAGGLGVILDYDPLVDFVGVRFHDSVFFDEATDELHDVRYSLRDVVTSVTGAGAVVSFEVMKTTVVDSPDGFSTSEVLMVRKVLLEGNSGFDPASLLISYA